jgi:hypothetical protein
MKKLLLVIAVGFCLTLFAKAGTADLFSYDKSAVNTEMSTLQSLEDYVIANPGVTLSDLKLNANQLVSGLNLNSNSVSGGMFSSLEPPLGVPSFAWGCIFGIVGVAIVYFVADDKEETKKAFKGCVVGTLVYIVADIIYVVAVAASTSTTTY